MDIKGEHFVTCGQMKILEQRADENGLSYYQMMENAGTRAAEFIMEKIVYDPSSRLSVSRRSQAGQVKVAEKTAVSEKEAAKAALIAKIGIHGSKGKTFVFCGKGNNGGDGFVVARLLHEAGYKVTVILVDGQPKTQDSIENFRLLKERRVNIVDMMVEKGSLMDLGVVPDFVVDAIYGTGFHGELTGNGLKAAIYINRYSKVVGDDREKGRCLVFALDIPSGMGGDVIHAKELGSVIVKAHYTIAFHAKKPVHMKKFAQANCGKIFVADIGIDEEALWKISE